MIYMGTYSFERDLSLVLGGEAGQGIKTIEDVLVNVLKRAGYGLFSSKELMSRIRGGSNSTDASRRSRPRTRSR